MTTGADLVQTASEHLGMPYWNYDNTRFGPYHADCSGWLVMIERLRGLNVPYYAENSEGQLIWARQYGLEIPLDDAYGIPGSLVSRWGLGNDGHIGMVETPTGSLETPTYPGHCSGRRNLTNASGRNWTNADLIPGVDYSTGPSAGDLAAVVKLEASITAATSAVIHYAGTNHTAIVWLQIMLNRIYPRKRPLVVDGNYGPTTLHALLTYEHDAGAFLHLEHNIWPDSGTVGPVVWHWLRLSAKI